MAVSVADNHEITPEIAAQKKNKVKIPRTSLTMWIFILVVIFVWEYNRGVFRGLTKGSGWEQMAGLC